MITRNPYGLTRATKVLGEQKPFVVEAVFTNDPIEMVNHCLNCTALSCTNGQCAYTRNGSGRRKYKKKPRVPPVPIATLSNILEMVRVGWRPIMVARELGLTAEQVDKSIRWAEKEGLI